MANNVKSAFQRAGINGMQSCHLYALDIRGKLYNNNIKESVLYSVYYYPLFDNYLDLNNFVYL